MRTYPNLQISFVQHTDFTNIQTSIVPDGKEGPTGE